MRLGPGVGVMGASMAGAAAVYPLTWAGDAVAAWDFAENAARWADSDIANVAATPNWTVNRASSGYALNAAGVLVPFSSGEARRTSKGLLVEGARTNLILRSQEFDNASWTKTDSTVTADSTTAPDGTLTADLVTEGSAGTAQIGQGVTVSSGATVAISVFLKRGNTDWVRVTCVNASNFFRAWFNLGTGAAGTSGVGGTGVFTSASVEAYANGFYRVVLVGSIPATTAYSVFVNTAAADNSSTRVSGGTYYPWGAQLEAASFPSSYIPTTTASVTRAGDEVMVTSVTGLAYPMTALVHVIRAVDTAGSERWFHVDDGTANERFRLSTLSTDLFEGDLVDGGVSQAAVSVAGAMAVGTVYKGAARFALNDVQACRDGTLGTADTSATLPVSPNTIRFGAGISVTNPSFGYVVRAAIYDYAMSNAQLQAITL